MFFRNLNKVQILHKNIFNLSGQRRGAAIQQLRWKFNDSGASIFFDIPNKSSTVFQVLPTMTFNQFIFVNGFDQKKVIYPPGINGDSQIFSFLLNFQNQQTIQLNKDEKNIILKNKASQSDSAQLIKVIRDKGSIYQHLMQFQKTNNPQSSCQVTDYLTRYYLKLQTEFYCKSHKIPLQSKMTPQLKQKILTFLSMKNQMNIQQDIYQNIGEVAKMKSSIAQTQFKIQKITQFFQNKIKWYKNIAIVITLIHLFGFAYMVFGVDWLGWDITQPLTYSIGVIYTLIGIRFYRKYGVNRSQQSIRQALFNLIMSPSKKAQLKQLHSRKQVQMQEYKRILQQEKILKNKLSFNTSLIKYFK